MAPRCAGEAAARERAAAHRGFTPALPHAGAARRALEEGGRQLGLRPGPVRTFCALLGLYRGWGLRRPPVLAATNAAIARAAGCDERTAQRHLALLRAKGLVLVEYGPHNRRRPEPDAGPGDPPASTCGRRWSPPPSCGPCSTNSRMSVGRRWPSCAWRSAPCCSPAPPWPRPRGRHRRRWKRWRGTGGRCAARGGGSTTRPPPRPSSRRCAQGLGPLRAALEALAAAPGPAAVEETVEHAVGKATDPSPRADASVVHQTESNSVEASDGFRPARSERPAEPEHSGLTLDELADREIEARQRAHRLGLAARRLNEAIERHGTAPVVAAVDHVWRRREEGRLRNPAGLLVCLLRRPPDRLPDRRACTPPAGGGRR